MNSVLNRVDTYMQSRVSIFNTLTSRTTIIKTQLRELVNFVLLNRGYKMTDLKVVLNSKLITITPISSVFTRAMNELHKETLFSFLRIPPTIVAVPEVVTYSHVTYDLQQLNTPNNEDLYNNLAVAPDFQNTILMNVTPLLRQNGELVDTLLFQSLVVRDLLSRSYFSNNTTMWLTPSLIRFLCRFYNMSMSSAIASAYNLTFQEQQAIATVFSLYFIQLVSNADTAETFVKTQKLGLGLPDQVLGIISLLKDVLKENYTHMSLDDACLGIQSLKIARLSSVDRRFLFTKQRSIGPDVLTSAMAIEYPPYWCYLVLATLSGRKMGLTTTLKRNDLVKDAPTFVKDLLFTQSFLTSL